MLVLHASLEADAGVLLWAERRADGVPATIEQLRAVLGLELEGAEVVEATGQLPTSNGRIAESGDGAAELAEWTIPALRPAIGELVDASIGLADSPPRGLEVGTDAMIVLQLLRQAAGVVVRQDYVPDARFERAADGASELHARWSPLVRDDDARAPIDALTACLPAAATAVQVDIGDSLHVPASVRARQLLAAAVDDLVRTRVRAGGPELAAHADRPSAPLHDRWLRALTTANSRIEGPPDALDRFASDTAEWQARLRSRADAPWRLLLRLEEPTDADAAAGEEVWTLGFHVQLRADHSVLVPADSAWAPTGPDAIVLRAHDFDPGTHLLAPLAEAARLFEPIADVLGSATPTQCELDTAGAHELLTHVAPLLERSGIAVAVPGWWTRGRATVSLRAHVDDGLAGGRQGMDSLNLATLVGYDWRAAIGDSDLTYRELQELAAQKSPLVKVAGRWVVLDPDLLRAAITHIEQREAGSHVATVAELLRMSQGAHDDLDGLAIDGVTGPDGTDMADVLAQVAHSDPPEPAPVPAGLDATLRPYQLRGFQWLAHMAQLGLGACLADDMGLGKTVQVLAVIQHAHECDERDGITPLPTLVVCPTTVLTNWQREVERFAPDLGVLVHHGPGRARGDELRERASRHAIVVTSYGLLARDVETLRSITWRSVVLDEAQNIKNPATAHARAARELVAPARVALTGTPVENHAGDLWSIMQFLNPGLLGARADFRRKYLIPIQTGTFPEAAERLRRVVAPFVLRREKTDRSVISDLPDKLEQVEHCHLTEEQVSLYEAVVADAAATLRMPRGAARRSGIERRGLILATIARLKQVCNHPAQLLGDGSRIAGRSGKLRRLEELVDAILDRGERVLVFTQFVEMGELLQRHLEATFAVDVPFLHGAASRAERDRMVQRFQDPGADAPPVLLLSLKAGGSGLNLTAASHVIHFDRWWNPAVEQQATDRAFRIGQLRDVQVHALVCVGTVEERIQLMLEQKRAVASTLVGSGEQWVTELGDNELLDLLALRRDTMLQGGRLDELAQGRWQGGLR